MKLKIYSILLLMFALNYLGFSQAPCWELVWADEFDVNGLPDTNKWGYDVGGDGWGNQEKQYYTDARLENAKVENGKLIITAIKEKYETNEWTSARLVSRTKGDWLYGKIEVKAKLPAATKGTWSAIWMLPTDWEYGGWPKSGEIDIMENVGYEGTLIHGTVHTDAYNHTKNTQKGASKNISDNSTAFHVYAIEWYKDSINFLVDDVKYFGFDNEHKTYAEWPFDKRFHILLNMAIGGSWGGAQGIDAALTTASMEIDYVRVYQKGLDIKLTGDSEAVKAEAGLQFKAPVSDKFTYLWEVPSDASIIGSNSDSVVTVNWGCSAGKVICHLTGECSSTYDLEYDVSLKDPQLTGQTFVEANQANVAFEIDSLANTTYSWTVPEGVSIVDGQGTNKILTNWNEANGIVSVEIKNSCDTLSSSFQTFIKGQYPYPEFDTPHTIPGSIEATDYDFGGEGEAYHDTDPTNVGPGVRPDEAVDTENGDGGQPNVGWINAGEWIEYSVNVTEAGWYEAKIRAASAGTPDSLNVLFDGIKKFGAKVSVTGAWAAFVDLNLGKAYLEAGNHILKYDFKNGGYNIGKITFTATSEPLGIEDEIFAQVKLYPNPTTGDFFLQGIQNISSMNIVDALGKVHPVNFKREENNNYSVKLNRLAKGIYTLKAVSGKNILQRRVVLK